MSQVQVPKISAYVAMGAPADNIVVTKLSLYVLMVPGDSPPDPTGTRQAHVYSQKFRRP